MLATLYRKYEIEMCRKKTNRVFKELLNILKEEGVLASLKNRELEGQLLILKLKAKIVTSRLIVQVQEDVISMDYSKLGYDKARLAKKPISGGALGINYREKECIYLGK